MFGSRKKTKEKTPAPSNPVLSATTPGGTTEYQTVDEVLDTGHKPDVSGTHPAVESEVKKPQLVTEPIINASDDFKIDSLRKKSPDLLALSGHNFVDNNNEIIPEPVPDYPVSPDAEEDDSPLPPLPPPPPPLSAPPPPVLFPDDLLIQAPTSETKHNTTDVTIVSTIPRDQVKQNNPASEADVDVDDTSQLGEGSSQDRWNQNIKGSTEGLDNAVFQLEEGPVPQSKFSAKGDLKIKQNQFPGLRKKVSWNNTVVYTSDNHTDIVLDALQESPDGSPRNTAYDAAPKNGSVMYRNSHHKDKHPMTTKGKEKKKSDFKCSVCCAVVLISLAMVAVVVLGTMYGVRYGNEKSTSEKIEDIKKTFALLPSGSTSVFMFTLYRPPSDQSQDGATYFLLERESIMPWQSPEVAATLVWLKGSAVKVHIFDRRGRVLVRVLGDPVSVPGAQFTIHMTHTDWYAAKLLNPDSYALVALNQDSSARSWIDANVTELLNRVSSSELQSTIRQFNRPQL